MNQSTRVLFRQNIIRAASALQYKINIFIELFIGNDHVRSWDSAKANKLDDGNGIIELHRKIPVNYQTIHKG